MTSSFFFSGGETPSFFFNSFHSSLPLIHFFLSQSFPRNFLRAQESPKYECGGRGFRCRLSLSLSPGPGPVVVKKDPLKSGRIWRFLRESRARKGGGKNSSFFSQGIERENAAASVAADPCSGGGLVFFSGNVFLRGFHVERKPATFFLALSIFNVYLTGQQCTMHAMCVSHKCEQFRRMTFFSLANPLCGAAETNHREKKGEREMRKHKNVSSFCLHA